MDGASQSPARPAVDAAVGLTIFALAENVSVLHSLAHGLVIAAIASCAMLAHGNRRLAAAFVSVGLITSSALLVHIWGGVIEGHFHFFVMIALLALYEDWLPFLWRPLMWWSITA